MITIKNFIFHTRKEEIENQVIVILANPNIKPEQLNDFELGWRLKNQVLD